MEPFTFASSSQLHLPVAIKVWVAAFALKMRVAIADSDQEPP